MFLFDKCIVSFALTSDLFERKYQEVIETFISKQNPYPDGYPDEPTAERYFIDEIVCKCRDMVNNHALRRMTILKRFYYDLLDIISRTGQNYIPGYKMNIDLLAVQHIDIRAYEHVQLPHTPMDESIKSVIDISEYTVHMWIFYWIFLRC